jgi:hypothetical protein
MKSGPDLFETDKTSLDAGHARLQVGPTKQQTNGLETVD